MALYNDKKGKYAAEYSRFWEKYVPKSGRCTTLQGEVIRIIGNLASEYYRNGNMNWSSEFQLETAWLGETLNDRAVFDDELLFQIADDILTIRKNGETGDCCYVDDEDEYDRLTDRAVEYCQFYSEDRE